VPFASHCPELVRRIYADLRPGSAEMLDHLLSHTETVDSGLLRVVDVGVRFRREFATTILAGSFSIGDCLCSESFRPFRD
jgi:hypothetical protein